MTAMVIATPSSYLCIHLVNFKISVSSVIFVFQQICENPKFFVEGTSAGDVKQGRLGNCWFVAASSCLAIHKDIWHKVGQGRKEYTANIAYEENQGTLKYIAYRYCIGDT